MLEMGNGVLFIFCFFTKRKMLTHLELTHLVGTGRWVEKNELTKL